LCRSKIQTTIYIFPRYTLKRIWLIQNSIPEYNFDKENFRESSLKSGLENLLGCLLPGRFLFLNHQRFARKKLNTSELTEGFTGNTV